MSSAWIDGDTVPLDVAIKAAGDLIDKSRLPLVTGLLTDAAGLHAALSLARRAGGLVDHIRSAEIFPLVSTLRDAGTMLGAPVEIRRRCDRVLIVGDAFAKNPVMSDFLFSAVPDLGKATRGNERQVVWLVGSSASMEIRGGVHLDRIPCERGDLVDTLGIVRAALADRPHGGGVVSEDQLATLVDFLKDASFGCVVFSPDEIGDLGVEMIAGLVGDLNAQTRFTSLPVLSAGQAWGAAQTATWTDGFPLRTSYARGLCQHDPQLFETRRSILSAGTDLAVYVDALDGVASTEPDWSAAIPVVAVTGHSSSEWRHPPRIGFQVATAGRDHNAVLFDERFGSFVPVGANEPREKGPKASEILSAIRETLGKDTGRGIVTASNEAVTC